MNDDLTLGAFLAIGALGWAVAVLVFTYFTSGPGARRG